MVLSAPWVDSYLNNCFENRLLASNLFFKTFRSLDCKTVHVKQTLIKIYQQEYFFSDDDVYKSIPQFLYCFFHL